MAVVSGDSMTVDLQKSKEAIHLYLDPEAEHLDPAGHALRLVIRQNPEGKKYIAFDTLGPGEKAFRFFGGGSASFKNVVEFALENKVIDALEDGDKQALLEKSFSYNLGHNWLRSFMRVNIVKLAGSIFGQGADVNSVISGLRSKVLNAPPDRARAAELRAKNVLVMGPERALFHLLEANDPMAASFVAKKAGSINPEERDLHSGKILLHEAIGTGDAKLVKSLLRDRPITEFEKDRLGRTALHLAVEGGDKEIIEALLKCNPQGVNDQDNHGQTALHMAIRRGQKVLSVKEKWQGVCEQLLACKELDVGLVDKLQGWTALHLAARAKMPGLMSALLSHQSATLAVDKQDLNRHSALDEAALSRNGEAVTALLERVSDETRIKASRNANYGFDPAIYVAFQAKSTAPLHAAMLLVLPDGGQQSPKQKQEQLDIMKRLIEEHNVHLHERDEEGRSPLHRAVWTGSMDVLNLLLAHREPLLNLRDRKGSTALHLAIEKGSDEIMLKVFNDKRTLLNVADNDGNTPLQTAILRGNVSVANMILDDPREIALNHPNKSGRTALMQAMGMNPADDKLVAKLLAKSNLSLQDGGGLTALHHAIRVLETPANRDNFAAVLAATLKQDASLVNAQDSVGLAPIHYAVNIGDQGMLQSLLAVDNIDPNVLTNGKQTALHMAILRGNRAVVELLVKSGKVDLTKKNGESLTPSEYARRIGRSELLSLLKA